MLIPLAYLIAARLWMGHSPERPLVWVAHAATAVILLHVLLASFDILGEVFQPVQGHRDNLLLGLVFSEAALFYTLAGIFRKRSANVYFAAAAACGALWQFMGYWGGIDHAYYTMLYAVLGIVVLVAGRAAGLEQVKVYETGGTKDFATRGRGLALFQSGNAILFVALLAALLQGLSQLATQRADLLTLGALVLTTAASYVAIAVVPAGSWRRLYWTSSLGLTGLCFLTIHVLSHLNGWQKLEIFCVVIGTVLIIAGYISRFRESASEYSESLTLGLAIGSLLVTVPLMIALLYWRFSRGIIHWPEELAIVVLTILMLVTGFSWRVKATTLAGGGTLFLYLLIVIGHLAYQPQVATGIYLAVGGGLVFLAGLVLSIYRDKLLELPDRIAKREGIFQIIGWRHESAFAASFGTRISPDGWRQNGRRRERRIALVLASRNWHSPARGQAVGWKNGDRSESRPVFLRAGQCPRNWNDDRKTEEMSTRDDDVEGVKRQLKRWILKRCAVCGGVVFIATFVLTQPSFGIGGPNFLSATIVATVATAITGMLLAARAFLHLQHVLAARAGLTLPYRLGRWLRGHLPKKIPR